MDQETIDRHIAEAIDRGVAHLTEVRPDWADDVDLPSLNLVHCEDCVYGQLYGTRAFYNSGKDSWFQSHGFMLPKPVFDDLDPLGPEAVDAAYRRLTELWAARITAVRAAACRRPAVPTQQE